MFLQTLTVGICLGGSKSVQGVELSLWLFLAPIFCLVSYNYIVSTTGIFPPVRGVWGVRLGLVWGSARPQLLLIHVSVPGSYSLITPAERTQGPMGLAPDLARVMRDFFFQKKELH